MKPMTFWDRLSRAVRDRSFIVGTVLVSAFILLAALGPEVAPHNPFLRDRIQHIDGQLQRAPFPPSDLYPLGTDGEGRDMLSLLLFGARQTLVIAFVAMTVRLILGLLLGTISGWWPGSLFDRAVTAVTEFLAAIPALILAVLLVYAVGIRRGQVTFIIALSLVGWGEIAQIIRGHVITLRNRLFILASRAVGLGSGEILSRHVLPNLLSTLLALAALEMGGVLLLLGELGFLHIFIGGGGIYISDAIEASQVIHYFEMPDWGAMLGTSWAYFRSLPWLPMAPALAFFAAILGFNLFGYGLQRFIEKGRFHPSGWSVIRFFAVVAVLLLGARALLASSSLESQFTDMAEQFNLQRAWDDISFLSQPALEGRPPGPGGGHTAAGYIAQQFELAGLTPLTDGTYFQSFRSNVGRVTVPPTLEALAAGGEPVLSYTADDGISFAPSWPFSATAEIEGELVVLGDVGRYLADGYQLTLPMSTRGPDKIWVMLNSWEPLPISHFSSYIGTFPFAGVLRVSPDEAVEADDIPPASADDPTSVDPFPTLLVSESVIEEILERRGYDLSELQTQMESGESIVLTTGIQARAEVGLVYDEVAGANVLGYFPAADISTQGERILVVATYTGRPPEDGQIYPGADENASGVAVMLEVARLWHEIEFEPRRTVAFVALNEGSDNYYINHPILQTDIGDSWTVVRLHGLGAGETSLARLESSVGLARVFDQSARRFGVDTEEMWGPWQFLFVTPNWRGGLSEQQGYTGLVISRQGDEMSGTSADSLDHLDPGLIMEAGQTVAHYLMVLSNR